MHSTSPGFCPEVYFAAQDLNLHYVYSLYNLNEFLLKFIGFWGHWTLFDRIDIIYFYVTLKH